MLLHTISAVPFGLVKLMPSNKISLQVAPGLQVKSATTLLSFPDDEPVKLINLMLVMLTFEGYLAQVVSLMLK
jgi:hypothetical protein